MDSVTSRGVRSLRMEVMGKLGKGRTQCESVGFYSKRGAERFTNRGGRASEDQSFSLPFLLLLLHPLPPSQLSEPGL